MKRIALFVAATLAATACDRTDPVEPAVERAPLPAVPVMPASPLPQYSNSAVTSAWTLTVLPVSPTVTAHHNRSHAAAVNESGWVAGTTHGWFDGLNSDRTRATLWTPSGVQDLGVLPPYSPFKSSTATAMNDAGTVVGWGTTDHSSGHCCTINAAFIWTAADGMRRLPPLLTDGYAYANGINNAGHVVGYALDAAGGHHAVVWRDLEHPPVQIPLPSANGSLANAINDAGQVVGTAAAPGGGYAFRWSEFGGTDIIQYAGAGSPEGFAINAAGHVVGWLWLDDGGTRPFLWTPAGGLQDLGLPPGTDFAMARAINDAGHIAVTAMVIDPQTGYHRYGAYLWVEGAWIELATPGYDWTEATAINEKTQVAGLGWPNSGGTNRVLVWDITLTPETSTPSFAFAGFHSPVHNPPTVNRVTAGRAIPLKFGLGGYQGTEIFAAGYPASQPVACDAGAAAGDVESTSTAGSSALAYDPATDRYTYVWKTERSWAGSCRRLTVRFTDGTEAHADFAFTR